MRRSPTEWRAFARAERDTQGVRISISADAAIGIAAELAGALTARGHEVVAHGALAEHERPDWAWSAQAAARDVAEGRAEQAVVCCWTGTGASIAANKVGGIRAALCADATSAAGARRWNDANVLALSLRSTSLAVLSEILDAWFQTPASRDESDYENIAHLREIGP
jgi:ribose 5-phosphate isomerase B